MTKNAPRCSNTGARGNSSLAIGTAALDIASEQLRAQDSLTPTLPADGLHLSAIWRGPRDRSRAIQFALREFNGHQFLDIRQYVASSGYMLPTQRGLTIDVQQLGKFAEASGKAYRRAVQLGLVTARSS